MGRTVTNPDNSPTTTRLLAAIREAAFRAAQRFPLVTWQRAVWGVYAGIPQGRN